MPLVGVGKLIIGSVFHTWMLKRALLMALRLHVRLVDWLDTLKAPRAHRRLIGWIQINNHVDYLDGWLEKNKSFLRLERRCWLVGMYLIVPGKETLFKGWS